MIYSKVYETGTSEYETEKMIKFIQSITAPSIIMIVAQAEAFGQMTDEAWAIFVSNLSFNNIHELHFLLAFVVISWFLENE